MGKVEAEALVLSVTGPDTGLLGGEQHMDLAVRLPDGRRVQTYDEQKPKKELEIAAAGDLGPLAGMFSGGDVEARVRAAVASSLASRPTEPTRDADGRLRGTADLVACEDRPIRNRQSPRTWRYTGTRLVRAWPYSGDPYVVVDEVRFRGHDDPQFLRGGGVPVSIGPGDPQDVRYHVDEHAYDRGNDMWGRASAASALAAPQIAGLGGDALREALDATPPEMRAALLEQLRASGMQVPEDPA